jgi:hypothetical protein
MSAQSRPLFNIAKPKRTRSTWTVKQELQAAERHYFRLQDRYDRIRPYVCAKSNTDPLTWIPEDDSEARKALVRNDLMRNSIRIRSLKAELARAEEFEAWKKSMEGR